MQDDHCGPRDWAVFWTRTTASTANVCTDHRGASSNMYCRPPYDCIEFLDHFKKYTSVGMYTWACLTLERKIHMRKYELMSTVHTTCSTCWIMIIGQAYLPAAYNMVTLYSGSHFCSCFVCFVYLWPSFSCSQLPTSWDCVRVWDWQEVWEQSTVRLQLLCSSGRGHQCRRYCVHNMRFKEMNWHYYLCVYICMHLMFLMCILHEKLHFSIGF